MQKYLTKKQVSLFKKNGCISPLNMIPKIQASEFRKRFELAEESRGGKLKGMELHKSYLFLTFLNEIARYPKILDVVEDLIGPDILVFSSSIFIKVNPRIVTLMKKTFARFPRNSRINKLKSFVVSQKEKPE